MNRSFAIITMVISIKICCICLLPLIIHLVNTSHEKIKNNDQGFLNKYSTFFYELKSDNKAILLYYFGFLLRRMIYAFIQVFMSNLPVLQISSNIFFSLLTLIYLLKFKPFKDFQTFIVNFMGEICFLIILISILVLVLNEKTLDFEVETIILIVVFGYVILQLILVIISFILKIREIFKKLKVSKETKISYIVS